MQANDAAARQLASLACALQLPEARGAQDWGVEFSDPARVSEFVAFFEERYDSAWSLWTVREYVDLVLQSAEEALEAGQVLDATELGGFVARAAQLVPDRVRYWSSLRTAEGGWPISSWLRDLDD